MNKEGLSSNEGNPSTVANFIRKFEKLDKTLPTYGSLIRALDLAGIPEDAFTGNTEAWLLEFTEPADIEELNTLFDNLGMSNSDEERSIAAKALAQKINSKQ